MAIFNPEQGDVSTWLHVTEFCFIFCIILYNTMSLEIEIKEELRRKRRKPLARCVPTFIAKYSYYSNMFASSQINLNIVICLSRRSVESRCSDWPRDVFAARHFRHLGHGKVPSKRTTSRKTVRNGNKTVFLDLFFFLSFLTK